MNENRFRFIYARYIVTRLRPQYITEQAPNVSFHMFIYFNHGAPKHQPFDPFVFVNKRLNNTHRITRLRGSWKKTIQTRGGERNKNISALWSSRMLGASFTRVHRQECLKQSNLIDVRAPPCSHFKTHIVLISTTEVFTKAIFREFAPVFMVYADAHGLQGFGWLSESQG